MSLTDSRGVAVSTDNRAALDQYETATGLLAGFFGDPVGAIDAALAADPGFVMGHCFKAGLFAIATEKAAEPVLRQCVEAATALAGQANDRERGHIAAARAWLDGDLDRAVRLYGDVVIEHPRDIFAVQMAHLGDFYLGQSTMLRDRIAQVLPDWDESVPGYGYVLGMHAFGLEETGDYGRAEATGRRAVELIPGDVWGIHAVAHVMEMGGRLAEGVAWMMERTDDWAPENMFAFHNWWHTALYRLDLGQIDRVLEIYDRSVRPEPSDVVLEMIDASALLWRLHLMGIDIGARWHELADAWEATIEDGYYVFNDMHAMMAFVGAGRDAAARTLLATLERRVGGDGTNAMMTRDVGLPLCRAIQAFGQADYGGAVDLILPVRTIANRFGGSHAQRDVIAWTAVEAALRGGQARLARALMAERTAVKPTGPLNWRNTARALALFGDAAGAKAATAKAAALAA